MLKQTTKLLIFLSLIFLGSFSLVSKSVSATSNTQITSGWNLVGNSNTDPVSVATAFSGLPVTSIWKWNADTATWSFYTPAVADGGAAYAVTKGYQKLVSINPGDGFWINASQPFALQPSTGGSYSVSNYQQGAAGQMPKGWNLISVGDAISPKQFNASLSSTSVLPGVIPQNLTTLWAWDNVKSSWYFYAPSLEAQGLNVISNYIASKGYLDFSANGKLLGQDVGFWVNNPNTPTAVTSSTLKTTTSTTTAIQTSTTTSSSTTTSKASTTSTTKLTTTSTTAVPTTTTTSSTSTTSSTTTTKPTTTTTAVPTTTTSSTSTSSSTSTKPTTTTTTAVPPTTSTTTTSSSTLLATTTTTTLQKQTQTISFVADSSYLVGSSPAISVSASSGLAVGMSSSTTAVCFVASGQVNLLSVGVCSLVATQAGNSVYAAALETRSFQVVMPAPTLSIQGPSEGSSSVGNVYKVVMSDGSSPPVVQWSIVPSQANSASLTSNADGSATVRITASDLNKAYSVSINASYEGKTVTKQLAFNPRFKYSVPSYPMELTHQYDVVYDTYAYGKRLSMAWSNNASNLVLNAFDTNGWLSQKITISIPNLASYQDYGDSTYDPVRKKLYVVRRHLTENKLLFVNIDEATFGVDYRILSFPADGLAKSAWSNVYFGPDYFFTARSTLTSINGRSSQYKRTELQILKVNYDGSATVAQTIKTSDIPGFGYSETSVSGTTNSPYIKIERNFGDLLISNIASGGFTTYAGAPVQYVSQLWVPVDPATLNVKAPIWFKADKFKRAAYSEQPSLNGLSAPYLNVNVTDSGTGSVAWHSWSNFVLPNAYSSTTISEGWLEALLSQDYNSISLNSYGVKLLDTTSNSDFVYSANRDGFLNTTKTNANQTVNRYMGDTSQIIKLPDFSTATNCNSNGYGLGQMGLYQQSSSNCAVVETYYRKTNTALQTHQVNVATKVAGVSPPTIGGDSFGMDKGVLTLQRKSDDKYIYLDLNTADGHPGCTNPIVQNSVSTPVVKTIETASVQKTVVPSTQSFEVTVASAQVAATVAPAYLRAPILCSDIKVSLDQEFIIPYRASSNNTSSVTPVTYSAYTLSLTRAPLRGTYDTTLNRYTPEVGFIGDDSFQLTFADGTGTQAVEIKVKTIKYN